MINYKLFQFKFKISTIALAISIAFVSPVSYSEILELNDQERKVITDQVECSGLEANVSPEAGNSVFVIYVDANNNNASLTINGETNYTAFTNTGSGYDIGTYAFYVTSNDQTTSQLSLNGDVNVFVVHDFDESSEDGIGANAFYALGSNSEINIGTKDSSTNIWTIAAKPDVLSAKSGGKITINSTNNRIVGSIDTMTINNSVINSLKGDLLGFLNENILTFIFGSFDDLSEEKLDELGKIFINNLDSSSNQINVKFNGPNSYWIGADQNWAHSKIHFTIDGTPELSNSLPVSSDIQELIEVKLPQFMSSINNFVDNTDIPGGSVDLTFENGAQWIYFGAYDSIVKSFKETINSLGLNITANIKVEVASDPKSISSITLGKGGIINLYDENIEDIFKNEIVTSVITQEGELKTISLWDAYEDLHPNGELLAHDYVRIGDLKGSDGIFRIDLNGQDKTKSDLIFIESSSTGNNAIFHIQPHGLKTLNDINENNTLAFAVVANSADIAFDDIENLEGETLFDYSLGIKSKTVDSSTFNRTEFDKEGIDFVLNEEAPTDESERNGKFYYGDTLYFIDRVIRSESASSLGMIGAGYAGYDLAVDMDRHDRRVRETVRNQEDPANGLWVRVSHGSLGASGVYRNDVDSVTIGFDRDIYEGNRLGAWLKYSSGDVDYQAIDGTDDLKRYEFALYDTFLFNNQYLDLVARFGRIDNDFEVVSASGAYRTSGDFTQDYAALSAEYGYTLRDNESGVFVEPQLQVQAAYLRDFDYSVQRGMKVDADSETSVIGRAGIRFGRQISTESSKGELYLRGDVLHQFTDGQTARLSAGSEYIDTVWGDKDTWANFGVGGFWNWKNTFTFQLDVERAVGGETADTWSLAGRAQYLF